ncbi:hypothetical protein T265_05426 [Opisthorchis viverrini]|uniref:Uncharacterized protein n=1 Tax=Opisthorchis viverrini TaxID=6198 RepID=A0A075AFA9_OPIVI|nr:hypothetical protein T265_05426 [Opisthorchis viverrini]KER27534.1 hypothetical protein T265_05426 [Opisthorchis viverrini]
MLGYVTIEVHGADMNDASRHARRLADNFLDDLDTMQRASRARDRRAMSHLETGASSACMALNVHLIRQLNVLHQNRLQNRIEYIELTSKREIKSTLLLSGKQKRNSTMIGSPGTDALERRRSLSYTSTRSYVSSPPVSSSVHYYYPRRRYVSRVYYPPTHHVTHYTPPVMMVGKSVYPSVYEPVRYEFPRTISNNVYAPPTNFYPPYTNSWQNNNPTGVLPTSGLRAHSPPRRHIMTPRAADYVRHAYYPWRRAYSLSDLYGDALEETVPRVIHTTINRRTPLRSARLGSVPPVPVSHTYRPVYYASEVGLPPVVPGRTYYRTNRYITETPYYLTSYEETVPRVIHTTINRRTPLRSARLGSVPPVPVSHTYRPVYYASEVGLPPVVPGRTYYRTNRYITETPYYLTSYTTRTAEPSRPILTTHYASSPAPITQRYTYYYPSVITGKLQTPYRMGSQTSLSAEVERERRRIGRRMDDDLLEYKLPPPEYYREMRGSLRNLQGKMDEHRRLLDRYSGIDMAAAPTSVEDRIESKYQQLASRQFQLIGTINAALKRIMKQASGLKLIDNTNPWANGESFPQFLVIFYGQISLSPLQWSYVANSCLVSSANAPAFRTCRTDGDLRDASLSAHILIPCLGGSWHHREPLDRCVHSGDMVGCC